MAIPQLKFSRSTGALFSLIDPVNARGMRVDVRGMAPPSNALKPDAGSTILVRAASLQPFLSDLFLAHTLLCKMYQK